MTASLPSQPRLSKSKVVAGAQCLKRLYLQVHSPELGPETDEGTEAIFRQREEVGLLAQRCFAGGVAVSLDHQGLDDAIAETERLLARADIPAIFEATFRWQSVLVRVDILERLPRGRWRLIEVKSSTKVKDYHIDDVAIQRYVLSGCGLNVASACVMHLNRQYIYDGGQHCLAQLYTIEDVTKQVDEAERELPALLKEQWRVLRRNSPPAIDPGPHCEDPVTCEFYDHCNEPLPDDHVRNLPRISQTKIAALLDQGISVISEIPEDFPLGTLARRACAAVRQGITWFGDDLQAKLRELTYPLSFMDFETLYPAIPRFAGMRPYDHIPFQWSLHRLEYPGAELEHFEFLATDGSDPRGRFVDSLCRILKGSGHIVVYNRSFEFSRLAELAEALPLSAKKIERIQTRLWDLLPFVRENVYDPGFRGSYSIKDVLPALIPEMGYDGMVINAGDQAGLAWDRLVCGGLDVEQRDELREALLAYCAQDTRAMARLVDFLRAPRTRRGGGAVSS